MSEACSEKWDSVITSYVLGEIEQEEEVQLLYHIEECEHCREAHDRRTNVTDALSSWTAPSSSRKRRERVLDEMKAAHESVGEKPRTPVRAAAVVLLFLVSGAIMGALLWGLEHTPKASATGTIQLEVQEVHGENLIIRSEGGSRIKPRTGLVLTGGETLWAGNNTSAVLTSGKGDRINILENTTLRIGTGTSPSGNTTLYLQKGMIRGRITPRDDQELNLLTPSGRVRTTDASFELSVKQ